MARLDFYSTEMLAGAPAAVATDALYELGLMYCSGRNGDYDLVEAHKWFNLAAMRGNADAKRLRLELAQEMTRAEISRAQKRAREWLSLH
jgi:TPR repeat protein